MLEDKARGSGVTFDRWQIVDEPTSLAVASLDPAGGATYDFYLDSTAACPGTTRWSTSCRPAACCTWARSRAGARRPGAVLQAVQRRAYDSGTTLVSYDPNVRPALIADVGGCAGEHRALHLVRAPGEGERGGSRLPLPGPRAGRDRPHSGTPR